MKCLVGLRECLNNTQFHYYIIARRIYFTGLFFIVIPLQSKNLR